MTLDNVDKSDYNVLFCIFQLITKQHVTGWKPVIVIKTINSYLNNYKCFLAVYFEFENLASPPYAFRTYFRKRLGTRGRRLYKMMSRNMRALSLQLHLGTAPRGGPDIFMRLKLRGNNLSGSLIPRNLFRHFVHQVRKKRHPPQPEFQQYICKKKHITKEAMHSSLHSKSKNTLCMKNTHIDYTHISVCNTIIIIKQTKLLVQNRRCIIKYIVMKL